MARTHHRTKPIVTREYLTHPIRGKKSSVFTTSLSVAVLNPSVVTVSISATVKLLVSIGIGALYTPAGPKIFGNILDPAAISTLSKLTYWIFQPCFLFTGVSGTLASAASNAHGQGLSTQALFLMPLAAIVQISLGAIAAKFYTSKRLGMRKFLLGIAPDDDEGASDVQMCATFANSGPLPLIFADALFHGKPTILSDVAACISFYLLIWSPLFWTFGRIILGTVSKGDSPRLTSSNSSFALFRTKVSQQAKLVFSPPVVGSLLGLLIGSQPILRRLFLTPSGCFYSLLGVAKNLGNAYLPAALLVLAGSLVSNRAGNSASASSSSSPSSTIHYKTILSLLFSRFLLSPIIALLTVRLFSWANLLPSSHRSLAIVTYSILSEGCMPPAQNSVIMLQLDGKRERAAKMARLLTVLYTLSTVFITFGLSNCLAISRILDF